MSTIRNIIRKVDKVKPNGFTDDIKLQWIAELDGDLALNVFLMDVSELQKLQYRYPEDLDTEPLVGYPYENLYEYWLYAHIDNQNGEFNRYQNSMSMYNEIRENFVNWFLMRYQPEKAHAYNTGGLPTYYITAYALAVKCGFTGTLEQWLASLKGDKGDKGDPGAKLQIGKVITLPAGSEATAEIEGTAENPKLNLGIPQGPAGLEKQLKEITEKLQTLDEHADDNNNPHEVTLAQLLKDTPLVLQEGVHYGAEYPENLAENQLFLIEV